MATIKKVENLMVFNRAYDLALLIHKQILSFPDIEKYDIANQMRRSSKSVCSNIAEGFAKNTYSVKEFKRFLYIAIGSAEETRLWLRFCNDLDYIKQEKYETWHTECSEIIKMMHGLIKNWKH